MQPIFFKPNTELVKWLIEYAGDRIIIDIGCGEKFLLSQQLAKNGAKKIVAIDPYLDYNEWVKFRQLNSSLISNTSFHVMMKEGQDLKDLYQKPEMVLLVFARPCHSDFVEEILDLKGENVEALYITVPENITKYDDLGKWGIKSNLINHKGSSADGEVIYSIK